MKKMKVEVCIISARGLKRSSPLWKLQWYAVGWIDPNNKYCTKIDASGSKNPTWKTKFSALIDGPIPSTSSDDSKSQSLHVEVYSRDPIFLREKLQGTATILLKEFLDKYYDSVNNNNSASSGLMGEEEVGSFQLRKKNSGKPQGFVDVSIRVYDEREGGGGSFSNYDSGNNEEGFELGGEGGGTGRSNEIFIGEDGRSNVDDYHHPQPHPPPLRRRHHHQPSDHSHPEQRPPAPPHWREPQSTLVNPPHWRQPQNTPHPVTHSMMPQPNNSNSNLQPISVSQGTPSSYRLPHPVAHPMMPQPNNSNSNLQPISVSQGTPSSYRPPPPPPPPPSHVGFLPTFLPRTDHHFSGTYTNNVGSSGGTAPVGHSAGGGGARNSNGFGMGMSAGALAAGAVLFGDDFMSGFDIPGSLQETPVSISTHPPF